ncbi:HAMP domain-containing sensor histidine kinase [Bdellovibrio sp. 22V]|uniref:sensor histidine kinase n=1 Tax=Bdellovibrio TaxID=958 RepID=UPI002543350E|nr:HAMP domain-containing sensor histidine kinase [Bdellovibrio sp. 22V]WII72892.1 HAMP domain-containing sensor histidine kinase [Bdellovibrio sp. 22V]
MKTKLIIVLVGISALFIGAVLWRTDSFVYGDRMSWVEAQTRTQLGAMNHSLATELKSLQRVVATFNAENFQKGKLNWSSLAPYYAAASFSVSGSNLEPQTILAKENSKAASWNKDFVKSALGSLARTPDMRFFVKPFQDSQRGRYVALVFLEGQRAYALFGSGEIFQSLIDAQRGSLSAFSIVTTTGLTVGHSVPEYLGTIMRDDPVFKEAQQSGSSHGSNIFRLKSGELYGMYEAVPQSNLLVLSSAPLKETMKGRTGLWWQFLLMGCGVALVGIAAALYIIAPAEKEIETLEHQLQEAKSKPAPAAAPEKVVALDPEVAQKEKVQASMRVASALAHEMRGPLASILGYSQMILAKNPESDIVQSTDSILRETRAARGVLDKLLGYAGEQVNEKITMKVEGPVVKALKNLEAQFSAKGVKLIKNLQETSAMDLQVEALVKAISNILQNSVEAMERMAKKEIKIDLFEDSEGIHLNIEDTGEGIEAANLGQIFDPFFTTRSFHNHMGLGLAVAFGILKEHNAEIKVESQRGQGTKVMVVFKKLQTQTVLRAPVEAPKEEPMMISPELPQLKEESAHREEAEAQFAEVQAAIPAGTPVSPLDVNIDNLLELPEVNEPVKEEPAVVTKKAAAVLPKKANEDELTFIDGFLGEEEPVAAAPAPVATEASAETAVPADLAEAATTLAEMPLDAAPISDELTPVNLIAPPKAPAKQKTSKLDSYHVEIRRPGKRI